MTLVCDRRTGIVAVDGRRLALPTLRQWCDWYDQHEPRVFDAGEFDVDAARLNRTILTALGGDPIGDASPSFLPLGDSLLTAALLGFWRSYPLDPWTPYTPREREDRKPRRPLRTDLTGGLGMRAVLYRALVQVASPREVDAMELAQIAMLLGVDDPDRDLDPDEDAEEVRDRGGAVGPGARVVKSRSGDVSRMSFRRHPSQPYLFSEPGAIHRRRRRPT